MTESGSSADGITGTSAPHLAHDMAGSGDIGQGPTYNIAVQTDPDKFLIRSGLGRQPHPFHRLSLEFTCSDSATIADRLGVRTGDVVSREESNEQCEFLV
jgi:hypothetical protein